MKPATKSKVKGRFPLAPVAHCPTADLFIRAASAQGMTGIVAEHRFHHARKWRFDYAWPDCKIALEVEGGVFSGGRHTRGAGFLADMEKYNSATSHGWRVFRCTPDQLMSEATFRMIKESMKSQAKNSTSDLHS